MGESGDPRVFFAAERTLLAWVRTGLTVMGLGFEVARFGLFLQVLRRDPGASPHLGSTLIGVGLVLLGSAAVAAASWQHARFCRELEPGDRPSHNLTNWSIWFAAALSLVGAVLAIYLLIRSDSVEARSSGDATWRGSGSGVFATSITTGRRGARAVPGGQGEWA